MRKQQARLYYVTTSDNSWPAICDNAFDACIKALDSYAKGWADEHVSVDDGDFTMTVHVTRGDGHVTFEIEAVSDDE